MNNEQLDTCRRLSQGRGFVSAEHLRNAVGHIDALNARVAELEAKWLSERNAYLQERNKCERLELTCDDIERLRMALSWEGCSTPEGLEACAARQPSLVRDLIDAVLARKKRARDAQQQPAVAVPAMAIRLGMYGKAFDGPQDRRAYTYEHQPDNTPAWKLGKAAARAAAGGDSIDHGLALLKELQAEGFGVFEIAAAPRPEAGS